MESSCCGVLDNADDVLDEGVGGKSWDPGEEKSSGFFMPAVMAVSAERAALEQ